MFSESASTRQVVWGRRYALASATAIAILLVTGLVGCSAPSTPSTPSTPSIAGQPSAPATPNTATPDIATSSDTKNASVPTSLTDAGEYSENVYDHAKVNDWKKATAKLDELKKSAGRLRIDARDAGSDITKLDEIITSLEKLIAAKDRQAAMSEANRATFIVAQMTAAYKRSEPVEVTLLDYYGRELELGAMAKDTTRLKETARDIRRTWDAVLPAIQARGGTAEARKFGDLVARVEAAQSPAEYGRLATPVLDEVDNLENVFKK